VFLVDTGSDEFDDRDVVTGLASRTETMAEHEPESSFEHRFISLLKAGLFVESKYFMGRGELLFGALSVGSAQSVPNRRSREGRRQ
jgi:hypothetical protein